METSVVIVNHNAGPSLRDCLDSVMPQVDEVVVVDNDSEPAALESVLAAYSGRAGFKVIRLPRNMGFSCGCNAGAKAASGAYLLFLNPDCIASPRLVAGLKSVLESHAGAGIAGGRLLGDDGSPQRGWRRRMPTPWRAFVRASGLWRLLPKADFHSEDRLGCGDVSETDAVSGACLMIRREVFERVGGFDEGYFLHCEDLDLCAEVKALGMAVLSCAGAVVFHSKGVCGKGRPFFVEWHKHRGMLRYFGKHFRAGCPLMLVPLVHVAVWCRFALVCCKKWREAL